MQGRLSLRERMVILMVAAILPLFALSFWLALRETRSATQQTQSQLKFAAALVAANQDAAVESAKQLLGAIGVFSPGRRVMRSVVAAMAGELYFLDADSARRLHRGNPVLASYLIGLMADRLLEHARLKPRLASARKRAAAGPRA